VGVGYRGFGDGDPGDGDPGDGDGDGETGDETAGETVGGSEDGGGCSCSTKKHQREPGVLVLMGLVVLVVRRRRGAGS
jgi:MYXO-CTERM domain-containing protein